ncbi:MAG: ATP-binding protein [Ignavibacteriales bacterium]|nr:ATP-binding protein [Ignavibacteriales bacterium]
MTQKSTEQDKHLYEEFARFFERPSRDRLRDLLKNNIGELPGCDFKRELPPYPKFSKHLLGFANSGGGVIILGVSQNEDNSLEPTGLEKLVDKAEITGNVRKFIPDILLPQIHILDFSYDATEYNAIKGKKFQVVMIPDDPKHIPFVSKSDGDGVRAQAIYVRRGTSTEESAYEELQAMLNRRLETRYSSSRELNLQTHIEQLKILYNQIDRYSTALGFFNLGEALTSAVFGKRVANPAYPKEDFESFIVKMIAQKKKRIEDELDLHRA